MGDDRNGSGHLCNHTNGLLIVLNANGLLWARHIIHDPPGMIIKNIAFLVLVWVCGAIPGGRP